MDIECVEVSYRYDVDEGDLALSALNLKIGQGEKVIVAGPAGSGKTTLIQLLDALILPVHGDIFYDGISVHALSRQKKLPSVRRRMGVLFQFPEEQFFQETAYDELAFALRNFFGPPEDAIEQRANEVTKGLGLDLERLKRASPFSLSSGEKRKVALASALMMKPEVLMLDEPTAGLDASGRQELIRVVASLKETTVMIVTHNQEDFLALSHRVVGIAEGRKVLDVHTSELFDHIEALQGFRITAPLVLQVQHWLKRSGVGLDTATYDMEDLIGALRRQLGGSGL